jgi:hypothetical protein
VVERLRFAGLGRDEAALPPGTGPVTIASPEPATHSTQIRAGSVAGPAQVRS